MPINKTLITYFLLFTFILSSVLCNAQNNAKSRNRPATPRVVLPYNHPTLEAPPGMVYIQGGSTRINYDQSSTDTNSTRKVSLTSFFIDKTEITNEQYRQFINWVIDSIAVVRYLKDDKYFLEDKNTDKGSGSNNSTSNNSNNNSTASIPTLDTAAKTSDTIKVVGGGAPTGSDDVVKKRIDWSKVNHNKIFNTRDADAMAKIAPMLDENGNIKKDLYVFNYTYIKPNNVGKNAKKAVYKTVPVSIYPSENVWAQDLTNSQTDMYVENYFKAPPFDDYPVVGVDWVQANAYAYWRSLAEMSYTNLPTYMKYYKLTYTLPSEAQWVYAAEGYYDMIAAADSTVDTLGSLVTSDSTMTPHDSATMAQIVVPARHRPVVDSAKEAAKADRIEERKAAKMGNYYLADYMKVRFRKYGGKYSGGLNGLGDTGGPYSDSTVIHKDINGMLENFKQDEGDYWEDGAALTTPVMAFAPNEFGLYNMEGNVAEWTMDAYSPSTYAFVSDLNPVLLYDADSTDADAMKRKVVRGGSFLCNALLNWSKPLATAPILSRNFLTSVVVASISLISLSVVPKEPATWFTDSTVLLNCWKPALKRSITFGVIAVERSSCKPEP